jgi:hypothetical protein
MGEEDLGLLAISALSAQGRTVHCVAPRRDAAVGPIQRPTTRIEIQIDRLWQIVEEKLDVRAVLGRLALVNSHEWQALPVVEGCQHLGSSTAVVAACVEAPIALVLMKGFEKT